MRREQATLAFKPNRDGIEARRGNRFFRVIGHFRETKRPFGTLDARRREAMAAKKDRFQDDRFQEGGAKERHRPGRFPRPLARHVRRPSNRCLCGPGREGPVAPKSLAPNTSAPHGAKSSGRVEAESARSRPPQTS